MKKSHFSVFLLLLAMSTWLNLATAQQANQAQQGQREQRRAELRSALQSQREKTAEAPEDQKQLSVQERMALRQQLRQQQEHAGTRKP